MPSGGRAWPGTRRRARRRGLRPAGRRRRRPGRQRPDPPRPVCRSRARARRAARRRGRGPRPAGRPRPRGSRSPPLVPHTAPVRAPHRALWGAEPPAACRERLHDHLATVRPCGDAAVPRPSSARPAIGEPDRQRAASASARRRVPATSGSPVRSGDRSIRRAAPGTTHSAAPRRPARAGRRASRTGSTARRAARSPIARPALRASRVPWMPWVRAPRGGRPHIARRRQPAGLGRRAHRAGCDAGPHQVCDRPRQPGLGPGPTTAAETGAPPRAAALRMRQARSDESSHRTSTRSTWRIGLPTATSALGVGGRPAVGGHMGGNPRRDSGRRSRQPSL